MGNIDARCQFNTGYLCFQSDKPEYQPGEMLTGKVFMRAAVPIAATAIVINVKG